MYSSSFLQGKGIVQKKFNNNTDLFNEQLMKVRNALNVSSAGNISWHMRRAQNGNNMINSLCIFFILSLSLKTFSMKPKEYIPYSPKAKLCQTFQMNERQNVIWSLYFQAIKENSPSTKHAILSISREIRGMWL